MQGLEGFDLGVQLAHGLIVVGGALVVFLQFHERVALGVQVAFAGGFAEYQIAVRQVAAEHGVAAGAEAIGGDAAPGAA